MTKLNPQPATPAKAPVLHRSLPLQSRVRPTTHSRPRALTAPSRTVLYDDVTYLSAVVGPEVADRDVAAGVGLMAVVLDQRNHAHDVFQDHHRWQLVAL